MTAAGASVSYTYDAQGRRVKKTVSGTSTDYFYSGAEVVAEKTGSTWTDYIFFVGRIAKQTGASENLLDTVFSISYHHDVSIATSD